MVIFDIFDQKELPVSVSKFWDWKVGLKMQDEVVHNVKLDKVLREAVSPQHP